jgi:protein SCO1/2
MNRRAMVHPAFRILGAAFALSLLSACGSQPSEPPPLQGAKLGGEFSLVDKSGKAVTFSQFAGKYRIVYFGYTFCPDVCPLDLQKIMQGLKLFAKDHGEAAKKVQPLFITVDPVRDTTKVIGEYTANFGPDLIGLTGTPEQVAAAEKLFAVYAQKRDGASPGSYLMDHSRAAYLMGPDGEPIALLPAEQSPQAVAAELAKWVK